MSQEKCTEFYTFYKMLSFRYAKAILREHIIQEINQLFDRVSIKCKLIIVGLPTSKEILQIRKKCIKEILLFLKYRTKQRCRFVLAFKVPHKIGQQRSARTMRPLRPGVIAWNYDIDKRWWDS